jgi:hypothetical protein
MRTLEGASTEKKQSDLWKLSPAYCCFLFIAPLLFEYWLQQLRHVWAGDLLNPFESVFDRYLPIRPKMLNAICHIASPSLSQLLQVITSLKNDNNPASPAIAGYSSYFFNPASPPPRHLLQQARTSHQRNQRMVLTNRLSLLRSQVGEVTQITLTCCALGTAKVHCFSVIFLRMRMRAILLLLMLLWIQLSISVCDVCAV